MKLIIAEKPDVMKQLVAALEPAAQLIRAESKSRVSYYMGKRFIFVCALGHIIDFQYPQEIFEEYRTWKPEIFPYDLPDPLPMKVNPQKKGYYYTLKEVFTKEKYDEIIVATDGDREGQGIYERIKTYIPGFPENIYESRMWLSEWTDEGIRKAFESRFPNNEKKNLKEAAYLRAMGDYYIGMNGSGICTCYYGGYKNTISIGRVQTAVGKFLEIRENAILNFKPEDYVALSLEIDTEENKTLILKHKIPSDKRLDRKEADEIITQIGQIDTVRVQTESRTVKSKPYKLCDAMDIQQEMNKLYGYSANKTSTLLQALYQNKRLTTYPGTKAHEISVSSAKMDTKPLSNLRGMGIYDELIEKVFDNDWHIANHCVTSKGLAHEAITPVFGNINRSSIESLTKDEMNVYKAVVRRYLQAFFPDAVFAVTKVQTQAAGQAFEANGKILVEKGYLEVTGHKSDSVIPKVINNKLYAVENILDEDKQTTPPSRYTDATILSAMKNAGRFIDDEKYADILSDKDVEGLGTGRTRGMILQTMKDHGYYTLKGKTIYPTKKLMDLMSVLPEDISITSPIATAKMEEALNDVEDGKLDADVYKRRIMEDTVNMVNSIKKSANEGNIRQIGQEDLGTCPRCGKYLRKAKGKYGEFIACSGYPECNYIAKNDKAIGRKCPKCGGDLLEKKGKTGKFYGCSNYPECTYTEFPENKTGETCPQCGSPMVKKKGKFGTFEACSNYPECRYIKPKSSGKTDTNSTSTGETCPQCGKPLVRRNGKYGAFTACSGYPECRYIKKGK